MRLPDRIEAIRQALLSQYALPYNAAPSPSKDEAFRQWSLRFAQQAVYSEPGDGWGAKRASPLRPLSKDTIAQQVGDRLYCWDLFSGVSSSTTSIVAIPESLDITGQYYDPEASVPKDSLNNAFPPDGGGPIPPDPDLVGRVTALEKLLRELGPYWRQISERIAAVLGVPPA